MQRGKKRRRRAQTRETAKEVEVIRGQKRERDAQTPKHGNIGRAVSLSQKAVKCTEKKVGRTKGRPKKKEGGPRRTQTRRKIRKNEKNKQQQRK